MYRALAALLAFGGVLAWTALAADEASSQRVFELRTYSTAPGRLDNLVDRFREHNLRLFQRHGINLIGAWVPADNDAEGDRLVYLVSFPAGRPPSRRGPPSARTPSGRRSSRRKSRTWARLSPRPKASSSPPTDYSPAPETVRPGRGKGKGKGKAKTAAGPRVYELRTYVASPRKLTDLNKRFREHTLEIFNRHGMTNVFYGVPIDKDKGADDTLIYLLAHSSREAAAESWKAFGADPEWQKVKQASEADGVRLAARVVAVYLKPVGFSPLK